MGMIASLFSGPPKMPVIPAPSLKPELISQ